MTDEMQNLIGEIQSIKERNRRVEAEKAWETSSLRIGFITAVIYIIAAAIMYAFKLNQYLLNALIPALGYWLSTQSLPFLKRWWIKNYLRRDS